MLNVLVEFLVCARGFCGVEVASTNDVAICCVEIEGICNIVEIAKREVLPLSGSAIGVTCIAGCPSRNVPDARFEFMDRDLPSS